MSGYKYNHGFMMMRAQPLHKGHKSLIDKMIKECKNITIILGSTQESRTEKNPFTFEERKQMVQNLYPKNAQIKIIGLPDLPDYDKDKYIQENQSDEGAWHDFVLENLKKQNPKAGRPEAFYCGDDFDGHWFDDGYIKIEKIERTGQKDDLLISATKIRAMMKKKNLRWKKYIPLENIEFLETLEKFI